MALAIGFGWSAVCTLLICHANDVTHDITEKF